MRERERKALRRLLACFRPASTEFLSNLVWNACLLAAALGLRLQKIIIPAYKFRGETAILECDYQLNGKQDADDDIENTNFNYHDRNEEVETLYSVKWYKDGEEFYRFVPKSNPPQNSYKGKDWGAFVDYTTIMIRRASIREIIFLFSFLPQPRSLPPNPVEGIKVDVSIRFFPRLIQQIFFQSAHEKCWITSASCFIQSIEKLKFLCLSWK